MDRCGRGDREVGGDDFRMIQVHHIYCACCFYYYYISSSSDHQALDPGGWGPLYKKTLIFLPCLYCFSGNWPLGCWWGGLRSLPYRCQISGCLMLWIAAVLQGSWVGVGNWGACSLYFHFYCVEISRRALQASSQASLYLLPKRHPTPKNQTRFVYD